MQQILPEAELAFRPVSLHTHQVAPPRQVEEKADVESRSCCSHQVCLVNLTIVEEEPQFRDIRVLSPEHSQERHEVELIEGFELRVDGAQACFLGDRRMHCHIVGSPAVDTASERPTGGCPGAFLVCLRVEAGLVTLEDDPPIVSRLLDLNLQFEESSLLHSG
jgi:hypothetical protein